MSSFLTRTKLVLEMVKFEHTLFALPFALMSFVLAARRPPGSFSGSTLVWIVLAMVGARSSAMAFNRLVDADLDAQNPRTARRHIRT